MTSEEIKKAMLSFANVKYKGIVYDRITAYIYRVIQGKDNVHSVVLQCELLDRCGNSVVIVEASKVELA